MEIFALLFIFFHGIYGKLPDGEKVEFCDNLDCDDKVDKKVCGIRYQEENVNFRVFDNECKLLKFGCQVDNSEAYGIIDMKHCVETSTTRIRKFEYDCPRDCSKIDVKPICGIREDGDGFKIRTFGNECQLHNHNCKTDLQFTITDYFICERSLNDDDDEEEDEVVNVDEPSETIGDQEPIAVTETNKIPKFKNLVVVDGSLIDRQNINQSIREFFDATHIFDLPIKPIRPVFNETTRRMMLRIFGPIQVYKPWVKVPKNISDNYEHKPTLSSCYHKCPTKCPDTYAPVCGVPGIVAREPSLMFQNHCFMDAAQCLMHWEGKSYTAESSTYIESSFLFCLGDELNGLYRLLPLIKTLQHMGRLKGKGHFRYKLKNMRFFNNLLSKQPRIMG